MRPTALSNQQRLRALPRRALVAVVQLYRLLLKPWLGNACRFEPSCSAYALEALEAHGAAAGSLLTAGRLLRCHPWCAGGIDAVPAPGQWPAHGLFSRLGLGPASVETQTSISRAKEPS